MIIKRLIVYCCLTILMFSQLTVAASDDIYSNFTELSSNQVEDAGFKIETKLAAAASGDIYSDFAESSSNQVANVGFKTETKLAAAASGDIYSNFTELSSNQVENVDYKIETNVTDSDVIVIAIHGGKIEKGTTELAYALSSHNNYSYYSYIGLKSKGNSTLHITSEKFDEPTALEMVSKSKTTLSIHGCSGSEEFTYIGGLDTELGNKIKESLTKYGFTVLDAPKNLAGISPNNIANKNMSGWGVQIEISKGLRTQFLSSNADRLKSYVFAISEAVNSIQ